MASDTDLQQIILSLGNAAPLGERTGLGQFATQALDALTRILAQPPAAVNSERLVFLQSACTDGVVLGVAIALQRTIVHHLKLRDNSGSIPQVEAYRLVDCWGLIESTRALLEGHVRRLHGDPAAGPCSMIELAAESETLSLSLAQILEVLIADLSRIGHLQEFSVLIDWTLKTLRGALTGAGSGCVSAVIADMAV